MVTGHSRTRTNGNNALGRPIKQCTDRLLMPMHVMRTIVRDAKIHSKRFARPNRNCAIYKLCDLCDISECVRKLMDIANLIYSAERKQQKAGRKELETTRRPASVDTTARRQFQATGQPVSRTQATDAMTSRLPRYEAKCGQRRCFQWGPVPLRSDMKGTELPLPIC